MDKVSTVKYVFQLFVQNQGYRAFHRFGQANFAYGGSSLGSCQFTLLPKLPIKMMLNLKVFKID
jgi:hypothetical protein